MSIISAEDLVKELETANPIDVKVEVFKSVYNKMNRNIKTQLKFSDPMVIMCSLMAEVPHLKIEDDSELLAIQDLVVKYIKEAA